VRLPKPPDSGDEPVETPELPAPSKQTKVVAGLLK
jgi:hypothetical protein